MDINELYIKELELYKFDHSKFQKELIDSYNNLKPSKHWKDIKEKVLIRDNYCCVICNNKNNLHIHHNIYRGKGKELLKDLVTLCFVCHNKIHNKLKEETL